MQPMDAMSHNGFLTPAAHPAGAPAERFVPPSPRQMREHLDRHGLRPPPRWIAWLPLISMAALMVLFLVAFVPPMAAFGGILLLPALLVVAALTVFAGLRVRRLRDIERRLAAVHELAMLRHYHQALRHAWSLLPQVATLPEFHARTVLAISHCLDQVGAFESAIIAYDHLIDRLGPHGPSQPQLRIQRAIAQIVSDHLTDGDTALRRLRGVPDIAPGSVAGASYRLALLIQQVRTHHHADAVEQAGRLLEDLRPLGTDAGYAHGLMALCCHRLALAAPGAPAAPGADQPAWMEQAATWWNRATMLLPVSALVGRFAELRQVAEDATLAAAAESIHPPMPGDGLPSSPSAKERP